MSIAIIILSINIDRKMEKFLSSLVDKNPNYNAYIVLDKNKNTKANFKNVSIIEIDHKIATEKGYKDLLLRYYHRKNIKVKSFSPDKALYYFCEKEEKLFDYYWFLEDDVLIPHLDTLINIDKKYNNNDLLVENYRERTENDFGWHWPLMVKDNKNRKREIKVQKAQQAEKKDYYLPEPWYGGWASIFRMSFELLKAIKEFVHNNKTLVFGEIFLVTLAKNKNLEVEVCEEFNMRYKYKSKKELWKIEEIKKEELYTTVKSKKLREKMRANFY